MVESSRFYLDTSLQAERGGSLDQVMLTMFAGIIEWSMTNGYSDIVTATDLRFERILKSVGRTMHRLDNPVAGGNTVVAVGNLPADRAS